MGRRKFQLGRTVKNAERRSKVKRPVGRPSKKRASDKTVPDPKTWSEKLLADVDLPSSQWVTQSQNEESVIIYKLSNSSSPSHSVAITHCVSISSDMSWTLSVHGSEVDVESCSVLNMIPKKLCNTSIISLLHLLERCNVCPGHPDVQFVKMLELKKGRLLAKDGKKVAARMDGYSSVELNGEHYSKTVRVSNCELLVQGAKCPSCVSYRSTLRRIYHRWVQVRSPRRQLSSSKTNIRWLNTPEKTKRYSHLRTRMNAKEKEVKRLREKITTLTEENGVLLESSLHSDFTHIMEEMTDQVHAECPDKTFRRVFWDQQLQALKVKDKRQIRWHPAMIKWCLHLKFISSGAYHALRSAGVITLPSERTLRDYTHWMQAGIGFFPQVDKQLIKEANVHADIDRFIVLCWDEIKIKENLIFDKHSCELVGFTNIGEVNNHLEKLKEECASKTKRNSPGDIASHMLLFMVRGMFSSLEFPYAHFATKGATADQLYPIVWEVVRHLEGCGLNVIAFSCDGASPNRKFYKMHAATKDGLVFKTKNPFCEDRDVYFVCDVPHLMKTTRNCWSNSFYHKKSRALWVSCFVHYATVTFTL